MMGGRGGERGILKNSFFCPCSGFWDIRLCAPYCCIFFYYLVRFVRHAAGLKSKCYTVAQKYLTPFTPGVLDPIAVRGRWSSLLAVSLSIVRGRASAGQHVLCLSGVDAHLESGGFKDVIQQGSTIALKSRPLHMRGVKLYYM